MTSHSSSVTAAACNTCKLRHPTVTLPPGRVTLGVRPGQQRPQAETGAGRVSPSPTWLPPSTPPRPATMPNAPPQPSAAPPRHPAGPPHPRDPDVAPSFEALLRHIRQEIARVFQLPPESRAKEDPAILSLAVRFPFSFPLSTSLTSRAFSRSARSPLSPPLTRPRSPRPSSK